MDVTRNIGETLDIVDAETVLVHEFGHLLGLDHVEVEADPESVMHAKTYIGPNMSFRSLSDGDVNNIRQVYD
jgi:predicted Zn-dependent protease